MNNGLFKSVMERVETWAEADQGELLESARNIEPQRKAALAPTLDHPAAIDQAIAAVKRGKIATDADVEAIFANDRRL